MMSKTRSAIDAVRAGSSPRAAANAHKVTLGYLYQKLAAEGVAIPSTPQTPLAPRLSAGDRVTLSDGRQGTVCARVRPRDLEAFVLPDDMTRVVTISACTTPVSAEPGKVE
jgi:hypothetical protein